MIIFRGVPIRSNLFTHTHIYYLYTIHSALCFLFLRLFFVRFSCSRNLVGNVRRLTGRVIDRVATGYSAISASLASTLIMLSAAPIHSLSALSLCLYLWAILFLFLVLVFLPLALSHFQLLSVKTHNRFLFWQTKKYKFSCNFHFSSINSLSTLLPKSLL